MIKILLVDDDDDFRAAMQATLESMGYNVTAFASAFTALQKIGIFDLLISDIKMPEMDGLELTRQAKIKRAIPVILITGFSDLVDAKEAYELGADELLPKPFSRNDMKNAIERCLSQKKDQTANLLPDEKQSYCGVHINDFIMGRQIKFNIFLCISDKKFIKIAHQGEDLSLVKIKAFKAKGLLYLYLSKQDYSKYVGFNYSASAAEVATPQALEMKSILLRHSSQVLRKAIPVSEIDSDMYSEAIVFVETTLNVITQDPAIVIALNGLKDHLDSLLTHSVGVSLYGVLLATAVNWNLPNNKFKISAAGLLADVGLTKIKSELLINSKKTWSQDDMMLYESHPKIGAEMLLKIKSIPDDIVQIVKEHHENCLSRGYPNKLNKNNIHPMARLVSVADEFCDKILPGPDSHQMSPRNALNSMLANYDGRLDRQYLNSLLKIFNKNESYAQG